MSKDWKTNNFQKFESMKAKGLSRIPKIGHGHLCPREE